MFKNRKIQLRSDKASTPDTRGWRRPFARIFSCGAGGAGGAGRPSCSSWRAPPRCSSTPPTQASVVGCAEGQSSPSRSLPHHTLMLLDPLDPLTRTMLVARRRHSDVLRRPRRVAAAQPPLAEPLVAVVLVVVMLIAACAARTRTGPPLLLPHDSRMSSSRTLIARGSGACIAAAQPPVSRGWPAARGARSWPSARRTCTRLRARARRARASN